MKYKIGDKIILRTGYYGQIIDNREKGFLKILFDKERHPAEFEAYPRGYIIKLEEIKQKRCKLKEKREQK